MVNYELAKKSEKYVQNLAEKINRSLRGAELIQLKDHNMKRANLIIREPFIVDKKNYFNGFASVYVKFNIKPDFLNNDATNVKTSVTARYGIARNKCKMISLSTIIILLSFCISLPRLSQ